LNARQETIKELQKCLSELERFVDGKKHAIISKVGNAISNTGGAVGAITFGIPKAVGEIIIASNDFLKIKRSKKTSKDFQIFLVNDERELFQLDEVYKGLHKAVRDSQKTQ